MANLATKNGVEGKTKLKIHTPLINLSKGDIIKLGIEEGVDFSLTNCYDPQDNGAPCGLCDSCFRARFEEAKELDPLLLKYGLTLIDNLYYIGIIRIHSARRFGGFPDSELNENLHGHVFDVKLRQSGNSLFYKDFKRLEETLAGQIKTLNHRYLNEIISNPTDWSIAEWVKNNIRSCGDFSVGIQSTNEQGMDIMNNHRYSF